LNPGPEFFKFENPTPVQTQDTIDPTEIHPSFNLRNYISRKLLLLLKLDSDSCPGPFLHKTSTPGPDPGPKKNAQSYQNRLRHLDPWLPLQATSGGNRSAVLESIPEGFCIFPSDPDPEV